MKTKNYQRPATTTSPKRLVVGIVANWVVFTKLRDLSGQVITKLVANFNVS